jgi:hypothetical protein
MTVEDEEIDDTGRAVQPGQTYLASGPGATSPADLLPTDTVRSALRLALGVTGLALMALQEVLDQSVRPAWGPPSQLGVQHTAVPPATQTLQRVATAAVGLGIETQRRCLNIASIVGGPVVTTMSAVIEAVSARGPGASIARRLGRISEQGLAEQRRNQEIALSSGQAVVRAVVAAVLDEVDIDAAVARVDLDAAVARVDLDAAVARVDLDAAIARVDFDAIIDRLDIDAIAARLDLDAIAARLDVDAVVDRVDLRRLTNDVIEMVDVDAVAARLDLDAVAARLDVDAVVERVDLARITQQVLDEVDVGLIVRESSGAMAAETVDAVRIQGMRADRFLSRIVDRVLQRTDGRDTDPPVFPGAAPMNRP